MRTGDISLGPLSNFVLNYILFRVDSFLLEKVNNLYFVPSEYDSVPIKTEFEFYNVLPNRLKNNVEKAVQEENKNGS